MLRKPLTV